MAKAAVRAKGNEIKVRGEGKEIRGRAEAQKEALHAVAGSGTAATADDTAVARELPAPTMSRVRPVARAALELFTERNTQRLLRTYAAALAPLGLDAVSAADNAEALQEMLDRYERLQNSADRQYQALLARMERLRHDDATLSGIAHGFAPGSSLGDAFASFAERRAVVRGTRRAVATRKKNQKAKAKGAPKGA
jgi:hypothetical protein